jgi:hypothetical protein
MCPAWTTRVCRLRGTPLGVIPGTYPVPLSVSGPGGNGVGSLSAVVTVHVCVQPASVYTPAYFVSALNPVMVAPYGVLFTVDVVAWVRPGAGASVSSVTGRDGGPLPAWLTYDATAGVLQGLPAGATRGDYMVDVRFAVTGTPADLLTVVVRVPNTPPVFVGGTSTAGPVEVGRRVVNLGLAFADSEGDARSFALAPTLAPGGLSPQPPLSFVSIEAATGRLAVSSISGDQGNHTLNVTCSDVYGGVGHAVLTLVVRNTAPALARALPPVPLVTEGTAFVFSFPRDLFGDADGDSFNYTASLPSFLALDAGLLFVTGTPSRANVGTHSFTIVAQDRFGAAGSVSASVTVNAHPVVDVAARGGWASSVSPLALPRVREAFNVSVPALFTDADGDAVAYSVSDGSQAPWLALWSRGGAGAGWWLTGTPDRNAHTPVTVQVVGSDGRGGVSVPALVVVTVANSPPVAAGAALASHSVPVNSVLVVSVPPSAFVDADGDTLTLTVSRVGGNGTGAVPSFVSVSGSSVIIGPRQGMQGDYVLAVTAVDGHGGSASSLLTVTVPNTPPMLSYTIPVPPAATAGTPWVYTLEAGVFADADGDPLDLVSSLANGSPLPAWLSFDSRRRAWAGTPTGAHRGTVTVVATASDPFGGVVQGAVAITVVNAPPVYTERVFDQQVSQDADAPLSFRVPGFADPDGDAVQLSAVLQGTTGLPSWIRFDGASARFVVDGSAAPAGSYFVVVTGTDSAGLRNSVTMKVDVQASAATPTSSSDKTLEHLAQYGTPVLLSAGLLLLSAGAVLGRHRRIVHTSVRVQAWSRVVLGAAEGKAGPSVGPAGFALLHVLHAHFVACAENRVAGASLADALDSLEQSAWVHFSAPVPPSDAFTLLPVKRAVRSLVRSIRVGLFEKGSSGSAGPASAAVLPACRALHRYLRLVLAVHAGLGWRLSPALKQRLFRYGVWGLVLFRACPWLL